MGGETPKGNNQAKQEQQVVGPFQYVKEAQLQELPSSLMPSRIEPHQPRIAVKLESAQHSRRKEAQNGDRSQTQPGEPGMDREFGSIRVNRVLEQHIEHRLIPDYVRIERELRPQDMRQSLFVRCEGPVGLERDARRHHSRLWRPILAF